MVDAYFTDIDVSTLIINIKEWRVHLKINQYIGVNVNIFTRVLSRMED